jgi:hypothetical protein
MSAETKKFYIQRTKTRGARVSSGAIVNVSIPETETWIEDSYHCPSCGVSPVYVEPGDGDRYVGPSYICAACARTFTLQDDNNVDKEHAALIRAAVGMSTGVSTEGAAWAAESGRG